MRRIAIIPARGGSKRLPRKNILELAGRPMLYYPISRARESGLFERIIVSTEDDEIAETAQNIGAEIHRRPPSLASDHAMVKQVCQSVLTELSARNELPEVFCCIYATAALLAVDDLFASEKILRNSNADVVMGVSEYPIHPFKALREEQGFLQPVFPDKVKQKGQNYPRLLASNGTIYWARARYFIEQPEFYAQRCAGYLVPPERVQDIDTAEDYERLRAVAARVL